MGEYSQTRMNRSLDNFCSLAFTVAGLTPRLAEIRPAEILGSVPPGPSSRRGDIRRRISRSSPSTHPDVPPERSKYPKSEGAFLDWTKLAANVSKGQPLFRNWLFGGINLESMASIAGDGVKTLVRHRRRPYQWGTACLVVLAALVMLGLPSARAEKLVASPDYGQNDLPICSPTLNQVLESSAPTGSVLVLGISFVWTQVEDAGSVGYWALDTYLQTDLVWQARDGSFYEHILLIGTWQTFQGAYSPVAGVPEPKDGTGQIVGAYFIHFTATFNPGSMPRFAFLGVFSAGGTQSDILLGMYAYQVGNNALFDAYGGEWAALYFDGFAGQTFLEYVYSYLYFYQGFPSACFGSTSVAGDIVT